MAKPADWKYQSGVCSSWSTVSCCVSVDVLLPLPDNPTATEDTAKCLKVSARAQKAPQFVVGGGVLRLCFLQEGLRGWAHQLESAVCLIDGRRLAADAELAGGQVVYI